MKFVSICPVPFFLFGHREIYHLSVKKATELLGFSHEAYLVNSHSKSESWFPILKENAGPLKRAFEFLKIFFKKEVEERIFFLEDFTSRDFCALFLAGLFLQKKDQLWVLFRHGVHRIHFNGKLHLLLLKMLKKKLGKRLVCLSDSASLCEIYEKNVSQKMHQMPIPHIDFESRDCVLPKKPWVVWWPGEPRKVKGLSEILQVMKSEDPKRENFKLILSEETPFSFQPTFLIQKVKNGLTRKDYLELLEKTTFVFLPYDPLTYKQATSGIFIESVIHGKIPLVKEGSWLAGELKIFELDALIVDWNRPFLFSYLEDLVSDSNLIKKLNRMREAYASFHSLNSFAKKVRELLMKRE